MKLFAFTLFFSLIYFSVSYGQGSIQGVVRDKKTKESIVGANVYILGTTNGRSTDLDGSYRLENLRAGAYKVVVSFISYESDTIAAVRVQNSKVTELDFFLEEATTQLTGVTIQERKKTDTDISMITSIKQSNQIVVGVSSQQIARSQDKDASEVIKRLPGVTINDGRFVIVRGLVERYNSVWLNNSPAPSTEADKRAFSFDVIPSNLINNILIYKTPSPEIPADFAGAHIQIFTKNVPDQNRISVGYSMTFNEGTTFNKFKSQDNGKYEWLGFDDGTHKLPGTIPSTEEMTQVLQNYGGEGLDSATIAYRRGRILEISKSFNDNNRVSENTAAPDHKFNFDIIRLWKPGKLRIGNTTALTYKTNHDKEEIYRSGVENYFSDGILYSEHLYDTRYSKSFQIGGLHNWSLSYGNTIIEFRNILNQTGTSNVTERYGVNHYRGDQKLDKTDISYESRTIYTGNLSGENRFNDNNSLSWVVGYSYANMSQPDHTLISYFSPVRDLDSGTYYPYRLDYNSTVNSNSNAKLFTRIKENIYNAGLNYKATLNIGSFSPEVKAGFFAEGKSRSFYIRPFGVVWARPTYDTRLLYMPIDSVYDDGNFNFDNNGLIFREEVSGYYRYNVESKLYAAYASLKIPVTNLFTLYGGLRIENYYHKLTKPLIVGYKTESDTLDLFPSIGLTVNLNEKNLIRLAYGKTINRPEFRERTDFAFYDFDENVIVYGNDTLKSCYINNFDLRYEWYPSIGEMITIGGFYKQFDNPIEATWIPVSSGGWDLKYLNAVSATSLGVEIDVRKNLKIWEDQNNMLKYLKNLTVVANASLIRSRVENDSTLLFLRDLNRPMYGQSPFIINAGFYYQSEVNGLSVSLLYNIIGKRIMGIGNEATPNTYEMPRHNLDLTIIKQFNKHLQLKLGIKELLNQNLVSNQIFTAEGAPDQVVDVKSYYPGRSYSIGLSYSFN
ncbi:MAG: TonB-dependent receptor [Bacteroidetes bacterium]|nr:MAG: TonB-dependent receptor [Bacteroidota bacterium]